MGNHVAGVVAIEGRGRARVRELASLIQEADLERGFREDVAAHRELLVVSNEGGA